VFTLYVCRDDFKQRATIHLIDEAGALVYSGPAVADALRWLQVRGENSVVCMTDAGPELFLIETCGCPALALPSVSMRRAHLGRCCYPPAIPGLEPDLTRRPHILEDRAMTGTERRRRRQEWLRRATSP